MQTNRIQVIGSRPVFIDETLILQEELLRSKKMIRHLMEEHHTRDRAFNEYYEAYKKSAEEHNKEINIWNTNITKKIQEERKKHFLERKAADDEIIKLRNERDRLISIIEEVREITSIMTEEPIRKKARIDSSGIQEFDSKFFDDAAAAWTQNKRRNGPGWTYKCIVPKCDGDGECDFDMCCYECFDKVCRNGSCKIKVTSKMKRGFCNECFESTK